MDRKKFLDTLYAYCDGFLELRALPSKHRGFYPVTDLRNINRFCKEHEHENVYFGVALRDGTNGTKDGITQIACAHCDIDFKNTPETTAVNNIKNFEFKPTLIVRSGGGFHLYWRLKEAYNKDSIDAIESLNRVLAKTLGGDDNAVDASRILRLPGTFNIKYDPPPEVKCILHENVDYDISDFDTLTRTSILKEDIYIYNINSKNRAVSKCQQASANVSIDFSEGHRDNSLFHVANYLVKSGMEISNIRKILYILGNACVPPFPEKELEAKIKSALHRAEVKERDLVQELREWVLLTPGDFLLTNADKELGLLTRADMNRRSKIFERFVKEGFVERVGTKRGCYRLVNRECDKIDFMNITAEPVDLNWPLQSLGVMVEVFPKNIIVVAGVQNAGKTGFMLDLTYKNMNKHDIWYFSSEMGAMEMRKRLFMFDIALSDWNFHPMERSSDFADVIKPDAINIIDYLELHDNFYQVGGMLKAIYDKLDQGLAFVALQKNPKAATGLGGYRGLEKPRLYINLESAYPGGEATIVKCKNWATNINPNGYKVKYKLIGGCHFVEEGDWVRE